MKRLFIAIIASLLCASTMFAQSNHSEGTCGSDVRWSFDGFTLTLSRQYDKEGKGIVKDYIVQKEQAPWIKRNRLDIKKLVVGPGITRIGSCAFANMTNLQEVVFLDASLHSIGWGAFLNCSNLHSVSFPVHLRTIGTIAFANCYSMNSVKIPDHCLVEEKAFASCTSIQSIDIAPTADLGSLVFATEVKEGKTVTHKFYNHDIRRLPPYINAGNCRAYGIDQLAVLQGTASRSMDEDYDYQTSDVDSKIMLGDHLRNNTYALIIGNQKYRDVTSVSYAIHDARVFEEYCKKTLGIPVEHIHRAENATKQMILEEELEDWLGNIKDRESKKLIVYYAGHGVPDTRNQNKAYILPVDVQGSAPQRGIALDDFYRRLGDLNFAQTSIFLDACFSGVNRENEGVADGLRGVGLVPKKGAISGGAVIAFSAAQSNETAQGYSDQGHGLFTYYLLKAIRDTKGEISLGELSRRLETEVKQRAMQLKSRKPQTPTTEASPKIADSWRNMTL